MPKFDYMNFTVKKQDKQLKRIQKKVNRIDRGIEPKIKTTQATVACANDGALIKCSIPVVGTGFDNRTGRSIYSKYIEIRGLLGWTAGTASSWSNGRIILVLDENSNGVLPVITDVLTSNTIASMRNVNNMSRFKILYDRTHANPQTHATINNEKLVKFRRKVRRTTEYLGTGVASADLGKNQLYLILLSEQTTASANGPTYDFELRLHYDDA